MNYKAFRNISYGVYVVSTLDEERPTGCIVNCAMQITSDPATVAISINHDNYTNKCIQKTGRFAVSVLTVNSDPLIIGTFGFKSGENIDKFKSIKYEIKENMPIVMDGCAYLVFDVINKMETDTHTVFLGKAIEADILSNDEPMTYSYYHKVIKGKSPKNAPTYIAHQEEQSADGKYVCSVCGYIYSGDIPFEELPDDYVCPICGQPKLVFTKLIKEKQNLETEG